MTDLRSSQPAGRAERDAPHAGSARPGEHSGPLDEARGLTGAGPPPDEAEAPVPARGATPTDSGRPRYLPALDGLRAVSVAAVLAYHLGRLHGGFLGVDVFFVVSGFLITRLLLLEREHTGGISLVAFWGRRFRRLVPVLLVVIVAVTVASKAWLVPWRMGGIRTDSLSALFYVANWRFIASGQSYFTSAIGPSPLRHTWSLAIEEQFYLLWPLIVLGLAVWARHRQRLAVMALSGIGALASAVWMAVAAGSAGDLSSVYFGTHTRAFALLAGAWVGAWWDPVVADGPRPAGGGARPISRMAIPAMALLVVAVVVGTNEEVWFYRGGFQAVAFVSALAVMALATGDGPLAALLGTAPLRWVGRRSYSIYLWSWPVQVFATERFHLHGITLDVVVVGLAVGLAASSFWLVEEPVRTGTWPTGLTRPDLDTLDAVKARVPAPARSFLAVGLVAVVVTVAASGSPEPPGYLTVSDKEAVDAALAAPTTVTEPAVTGPTMATSSTSTPTNVIPGPFDAAAAVVIDPGAQIDAATVRGRPLRVMVAGDSVGWSLAWRLPEELSPSIKVSDRAIIGCGLMPPDSSWIIGVSRAESYPEPCRRAPEAELLGLQEKPDVVLLWVGAWEVYDHTYQGRHYAVGSKAFGTLLESRIQDRVDLYRMAGVPTLLPVVPCFGEVAQRLGVERYDMDRIAWVNARLEAVARRNPGWVRMVDPQAQLCTSPDEARDTTETGTPIRADGAHFSSDSATWFWNTWLAGQMGAAFAPAS